MLRRRFWTTQLEAAWAAQSVVWLAGVRRSGKTTLCRGLPDTVYFDCELPRVRRALEDVEAFLEEHQGQRVVLAGVY